MSASAAPLQCCHRLHAFEDGQQALHICWEVSRWRAAGGFQQADMLALSCAFLAFVAARAWRSAKRPDTRRDLLEWFCTCKLVSFQRSCVCEVSHRCSNPLLSCSCWAWSSNETSTEQMLVLSARNRRARDKEYTRVWELFVMPNAGCAEFSVVFNAAATAAAPPALDPARGLRACIT